ncbi:MAG: PEP-CTERM sorting domain-containing protein [Opitutae bacterium]|nr:PEP-CTERM sorting domain-containing protein [Opitutae bacterium]
MKRVLLFLVSLTAGATGALAQSSSFTRIADTTTAVPDGTGNFSSFSNALSVDSQGNVAFMENHGTTNNGVYLASGGNITRMADLNTAIPNGTGNFTGFSFFGNGLDGGRYIFRGNGANSQAGLYAYANGSLTRVADTTTAIPGGTGNFSGFGTGYVSGTNYAFIASGTSSQQGIYVSDGTTLTRIADKTSTVPGIGGSYSWSSQLNVDGGNIAFWGTTTGGTNPGAMLGGYTPGAGLVTLASTGTVVPGLATNFTAFTSPIDLSGTSVVFRGAYSGGAGIFTTDLVVGAIARLVDLNTAAPGQAGNFIALGSPNISGANVTFLGSFTGGSGIYLASGGAVEKIIDTGDMLEGHALSSFSLSENGLADGYVAFRAFYVGGGSGIYLTQIASAVPEPSAYALLAGIGALGVAAWRRRTRHAIAR